MVNVKQFVDFLGQMDWEGGVEGIVRHGFDTSGDVILDDLLDQVDSMLQEINSRIDLLNKRHKEEIDKLQSEEENNHE